MRRRIGAGVAAVAAALALVLTVTTASIAVTEPEPSESPTASPGPPADRPRLAFTDDGSVVSEDTLLRYDQTSAYPDRTQGRATEWDGRENVLGYGRSNAQASAPEPTTDLVAFVSDDWWNDSADPRFDAGDVWVRTQNADAATGYLRVTCDAATEQHPVIDPTGQWVAYATNRDGTYDVVVVPVPYDTDDGPLDACTDDLGARVVASGGGDQTWPAWTASGGLVYSTNDAEGFESDLLMLPDPLEQPTSVVELTDGQADETQPAATQVFVGQATPVTVIAFRTDEFRPDGSIAFIQCTDLEPCRGENLTAPASAYVDTAAGTDVQGAEPIWSNAEPTRDPANPTRSIAELAFTSTTGDSDGDVWVGEWSVGADEARYLDQDRAVAQPLRAEIHPTWTSQWSPVGEGENDPGSVTLWSTASGVDSNLEVGAGNIQDVLASDGSQRRTIVEQFDELATDERAPTYSPDGERLAFSQNLWTEDGESYVMGRAITVGPWDGSASGAELSPLPYERAPSDLDVDPVWSPDGTSIAFVRYVERQEGDPAQTSGAPEGYRPGRIYVVDTDSGVVRPLVDTDDTPEGIGQSDPSWSPDGTRVAFSRTSEPWAGPPTDLGLQIADVAAATAQSLLTESPLPCPTPTCDLMVSVLGRHPAWSPDGERLVVADLTVPTVSGTAVTVDGRGALAVVDVAGGANGTAAVASNPVLLTRPAVLATERDAGAVDRIWREVASAAEPAWSPDGTRIAFSGTAAGEAVARDLWTIAVDGSDLIRVTNDPTRQTDPAWQPAPEPELTVAASEPAPSVGTTVTLTATVVPGTTAPLGATRVTFTLPEQLEPADGSDCFVSGSVVTCPVPPLPLGTSHDVTITVEVVDEGEATVDAVLTYPDGVPIADASVTLTPALVLTRPRLAFTDEGTWIGEASIYDHSAEGDPAFPARTSPRYSAFGPNGYLGSGRSTGQATRPDPWDFVPVHLAYVSTGLRTTTAGSPEGDVYVWWWGIDRSPEDLRITCDALPEQHPVVSPDNEWVAYAVQTASDGLDVVASPIPYGDAELGEDDVETACGEGLERITIAGGPGDQTWPTWVPATGSLVYSGSSAPGEPADLYLVQDPLSAERTTGRLTDTAADESQPAAVSLSTRDGGSASVIALRTTAFRPDGSLGFLVCQQWNSCDEGEYGEVIDGYAGFPGASVQGSEPAWMPYAAESTAIDAAVLDVAFTSTTGDEAGDVWVGSWYVGVDAASGASVVRYSDQDRAVAEPGVSASHPSWDSLWDGESTQSADLLVTGADGDGNVDDAHVPDFTERRAVQADEWFYSDGSNALDERQPAYSGDGERLAFSTDVEVPCLDGEIYDCGPGGPRVRAIGVSDWRGDGTQVLAYDRAPHDLDVDPVWSPDSSTIAFVRYSQRGEEDRATSAAPDGYQPGRVMLLDVATGDVTPLLPDGGVDGADDGITSQRDPAFSPDGSTIALTLSRDPWAGAPQELGVVLVDVATLAAAPLTVLPPTDCPLSVLCQPRPVTGRHPTWSPDGTRLALADVTVAQPVGTALRFDGRGALTVLDLPGWDGAAPRVPVAVADLHLLTRAASAGETDVGAVDPALRTLSDPGEPAWSPDGTAIAFSAALAGRDAARDVWTVAPDGSTLRRVTNDRTNQTDPAWQGSLRHDLGVTLAADQPALAVGQSTTLRVGIASSGPGDAPASSVTVVVPDSLTVTDPGTCAPSAAVGWDCAVPALAVGSSYEVALTVRRAVAGDSVVTATLPPGDAVAGNDSVTLTITTPAGGTADLVVSVALGSPVAVPGATGPVLWRGGQAGTAIITVRNTGTAPAVDVAVATTWPADLLPSGNPGTSACTSTSGSCALGTLAPGTEVVLTAAVAAVGPVPPAAPTERSEPAPAVGPVEPPVSVSVGAVATTATPQDAANDSATAAVELRLAQLRITHDVARPGNPVVAMGQYFPPGAQVDLVWSRGVTTIPGPYTVREDGTLVATVPVIADGLLADRDLAAVPATGEPTSWGDARSRLLVISTTVAAPHFLFRS